MRTLPLLAALALAAFTAFPTAVAEPTSFGFAGWTVTADTAVRSGYTQSATIGAEHADGTSASATADVLNVQSICSRWYWDAQANASAAGHDAAASNSVWQGCPAPQMCIPVMCVRLPVYVPTASYCTLVFNNVDVTCTVLV